MKRISEIMGANLARQREAPRQSQISVRVGVSEPEFLQAMEVFSISFPNLELTEMKMQLWFELLRDMSLEQLKKGVMRFLQSHPEIYPNTNVVAYIRKYGLSTELQYPTAAEAWEMVKRELCRVGGTYGRPDIPCEPVQKAVESIGWRDICQSDAGIVRAHFFKAYEQIVKRNNDVSILGPVAGEA